MRLFRKKAIAADIADDLADRIDFDQESIPVDGADATSMFMQLAMAHGSVMGSEEPDGTMTITVNGRSFTGRTQPEALRKAFEALA